MKHLLNTNPPIIYGHILLYDFEGDVRETIWIGDNYLKKCPILHSIWSEQNCNKFFCLGFPNDIQFIFIIDKSFDLIGKESLIFRSQVQYKSIVVHLLSQRGVELCVDNRTIKLTSKISRKFNPGHIHNTKLILRYDCGFYYGQLKI